MDPTNPAPAAPEVPAQATEAPAAPAVENNTQTVTAPEAPQVPAPVVDPYIQSQGGLDKISSAIKEKGGIDTTGMSEAQIIAFHKQIRAGEHSQTTQPAPTTQPTQPSQSLTPNQVVLESYMISLAQKYPGQDIPDALKALKSSFGIDAQNADGSINAQAVENFISMRSSTPAPSSPSAPATPDPLPTAPNTPPETPPAPSAPATTSTPRTSLMPDSAQTIADLRNTKVDINDPSRKPLQDFMKKVYEQ